MVAGHAATLAEGLLAAGEAFGYRSCSAAMTGRTGTWAEPGRRPGGTSSRGDMFRQRRRRAGSVRAGGT
ncbi:hypothetical protein [Streptosporangium amethystogenes]|uniref:hypothetical protein n=1 Tax=Streptosporangium amethystogenes TaxID=2002 RepID=UPI0004C61A13|nr:hypothetical protein [Streptosporangium amethystogenes]